MNVNLCNAMLIKSIEISNGRNNIFNQLCAVHFVAFELTQSTLLTCTSRLVHSVNDASIFQIPERLN